MAALDTTNDSTVNYDTLVFFDQAHGIQPGPFSLPSTGPAYVRASDGKSSPFFLEGSSSKAGVGYYVSTLEPNLSTVRLARYSANAIPRNTPVLADVDDINTHVGFWAPQADFRIPERLSPGFGPFPDLELEAMYEDTRPHVRRLSDPRRSPRDRPQSQCRPGDGLHRAAGRLRAPIPAHGPPPAH